MEFLVCMIIGYLVGTVNPAYIFGKIKGLDIRKKGSGNAGASNALMLFGKITGALCAVIDITKTVLVINLTTHLFPHYTQAFAVTATCCIIGHIFPFYMGFKGGKGLACLGGMILAFDWRVLLVMLFGELLILLITKYLCFVPITGSCFFVAVYGIFTQDLFGTVILLLSAAVIFTKHMENLRRIAAGTELHISYLWNPEQELQRLAVNLKEDQTKVSAHFSSK